MPSDDFTWYLGFLRYYQWSDDCMNGGLALPEALSRMKLIWITNITYILFGVTIFSTIQLGLLIPLSNLFCNHCFRYSKNIYYLLIKNLRNHSAKRYLRKNKVWKSFLGKRFLLILLSVNKKSNCNLKKIH